MQIYTKDNSFLFHDKYSKTTKIVKYYHYKKRNKFDPILMYLYFQGVKKRTKTLEKMEFELKKNYLYDLKCDINITNYHQEILIAKSVDFINLDLSLVDEVENNKLINDFFENDICDMTEFNNALSDYKMELKALKDDYSSYANRLSSDEVYNHDENYLSYNDEVEYANSLKDPIFDFEIEEVSTLIRSNDKNYNLPSGSRNICARFQPKLKDEDITFDINLDQANHYIYYSVTECEETELKVYSAIIGGFATSRLFKEVREKNSLCYFVYSRDLGKNNIYIHTGLKYDNIKKAEEIISELLKVEITAQELQDAKTQLVSFYNKKRNDYFMNKKLVEDYLFEDKNYEIDVIIQKINDVKLEKINELNQSIIRKNSITVK